MDLTYQQILAEVYEDNARNLLVHHNEYSDEEQDAYEEHDYEANSLPDKEEFNKHHGDRNKPENVIKPDSKEHGKHKKPEVRTIVLNIDGAFRGNIVPPPITISNCTGLPIPNESQSPGTNSAYFTFSAHKLYRNITSVKMTSMEFSNSFYTFSTARGNTKFTITRGSTIYNINIRDGNYKTPSTLVTELTTALASVPGVTFTYDDVSHKFKFSGLTAGDIITFPSTITNPYGNGIGYNLGFLNTSYTVGTITNLESDQAPDLVQDTYVYLQINDWNLLEHQQYGQTFFSVFSKIQLTGPKNTIIFDNNYTNSSTKEYVFPQPVNLQKFEIRMLDAYGNTLDLRNSAFSMTLELQQVDSSAVYEDLIKTL
jgi:hypothetical protein